MMNKYIYDIKRLNFWKHFGIFIFLTVFLTAGVNAQWTTQSPVPTHLQVTGVGAPTAGHVFIATADDPFDNGGALFESPDGGVTWIQRDVPFNLNSGLNGMFFLDSLNGWVYGNINYRTTDGGATWTELPFLGSAYYMEFYTVGFGLTTGNFGRYISRDGGLTWVTSPNDMFAFDFIDDLLGLGVADSSLYRTTDGGNTFMPVFTGLLKAVAFISASTVVGISDNRFIRSTDAGLTWSVGDSAEGKNHLTVISGNIILAWGRSGSFPNYNDRVLRSADGGLTWTDLGEVIPGGVQAFTALSGQNAIAADLNGNMFLSSDAGQSWLQTFSSPGPSPSYLSTIAPVFGGGQTGYFAYGPGFVIKTIDGGINWMQISSGTAVTLNDMDRFDGGRLIAVGDDGTLVTNATGASSWLIQENLSNFDLEAVDVIGPQEVVTVDRSGIIYLSPDAGASWSAGTALPLNVTVADVHFKNLLDGWVIGAGFNGAALFHTTDGGNSWIPITDFQGIYVAVDFEGTNGWAASKDGKVFRSIDNGSSWIEEQLPGSTLSINDLDFYDVSIGYAVGGLGYAARSDDGGMSWQIMPTPNLTDQLTDICLVGPNELWVSTTSGRAYYTATGGQSWAVMDAGQAGFGAYHTIVADTSGDAWMAGWQGTIRKFTGPPPPPVNQPPAASFDFTTNGLTALFTDTSIDPDGTIISWLWDFGDTTSSTLQNPEHTYAQANTYIVRLTVTDDDGETGSAVRFVVVQPGPGGTFGDFTEVTPLDSLFVTPQNEDFWVISTAPADYDGDGDLDIAVLGYYVIYNQSVQDRLVLITNDGPAGPAEWEFSYIDVSFGTLSSGSSDLAWGDVDGDGDQDLAVGTDGETVIYRNDSGVLVLTDTNLPGYWEDNSQADFDLRSITWADFDNDSDLDILLPSVYDNNTFSYRTALMRNDGPNGSGGWIFTETDSVFAPTIHAQSTWADYDNDQDLDLLLVNIAPLTDEGFIRRYRNDGNSVFVGEDILDSLTIEHGEAQWGDYDADGDLDILVAGHIKELNGSYNQSLRIYQNDNENYTALEVISCVPCEGWIDLTAATWADYDSDGDMDILLAGTYNSGSQIEGRARIYANTNGVFTDSGNELPAPRASGSRGGTFSWLDIDSEGDLDYFIAGQYFVPGGNGLVEAQMHIYRNDSPGQNNVPTAPTGLSAIVQPDNSIILSWVPASDDHTPSTALTYELNLFQNGLPVISPHRLPQPGNISAVTNWSLTPLPDGQYEWSLCAVDASYSDGPIATGQFTVGTPTVLNQHEIAPQAYTFPQNYPNPFNPVTTFSFTLPEQTRVELAVYNLQGQLITRLENEERPAGTYRIQWDARGVASGTYFVRLSTAGFVQTRRVTLLK
ncbi:MAG: VCBS repeat-containing protein [bacterium]|nr:MAG: VCBS repeat-containing protein [bacterium]